MSKHHPLPADTDAAQPPTLPKYALVSAAAAQLDGMSPSGAWRLGHRTDARAASVALAPAPRPWIGS